jgi:hypothetical protein
MNTTPNRRHDDYRPASLRNFWQSLQNGIWKLQNFAVTAFDIVQLVFFCAVVAGLLVLSLFVLFNLRSW